MKTVGQRLRFWNTTPLNVVLHLILILTSIIALIPFVWMVATSLKGPSEVLTATPTFFPTEWR